MNNNGVLILGGAGFVGRNLLEKLSADKQNIYIIMKSHHAMSPLPGVQYYTGSLDDAELLNDLLPRCRVVVHLASGTTPGSSFQKPSIEADRNIKPTLKFLEILHNHEGVGLIYMSSGGAVYGDVSGEMINEETMLSPLSYYGAGKAAIEKFIIAFCHQAGRSGVILRPSNLYGPGQLPRTGFGLIPTIFQKIYENKPLQIWGDGEIVRDYIYIDDLTLLTVKLIKNINKHEGVNVYNVGAGKGYTINQLCELVETVSQKTLEREYILSRSVDVKRIITDISRVKKDCGWQPKVDLLTGLKTTWDWFCSQRK